MNGNSRLRERFWEVITGEDDAPVLIFRPPLPFEIDEIRLKTLTTGPILEVCGGNARLRLSLVDVDDGVIASIREAGLLQVLEFHHDSDTVFRDLLIEIPSE